MLVLDTNVLVHAANHASPQHPACRRLVEQLQAQTSPWHLTWSICYEFLRVATHPRVFSSPWSAPEAITYIAGLLASPGHRMLVATELHATLLSQMIQELPFFSGNKLHDLHIAVLMREHGIRRIYTRDTDFNRFPGIEVIDPVRELP